MSSPQTAPVPRPLRFSDVLDELESISSMARGSEDPTGLAVAAACGRAGRLLTRLRAQFMDDVVLVDPVWVDASEGQAG